MRLFIALTLPPEIRQDLVRLQSSMPTGRPVPEENLHLTLAFLGEQPQDAAAELHDSLETLRAPAPEITLQGVEVLGGKHGQAVALGAECGAPLFELHDRVRGRMRSAGIVTERRRFRPHVTLARLPGRSDASRSLAALVPAQVGPFACPAFSLFSSTLHPDGAIHEELARYPLS